MVAILAAGRIFVSHASADRVLAETLVAAIEGLDAPCWLAARDVSPGGNFQREITEAIQTAKAMVLIFSSNANLSGEMKKELALASQFGIPVLPVRIDATLMDTAFQYELATRQWIELDVHQPDTFAKVALRIVSRDLSSQPATPAMPHLELPDKPSIAVLAFDNMSGDAEQAYFADGIAEDIITGLCRHRWLFVIARGSSFTYRGRNVDVRTIGRELGVRYVLAGSVRRAGDRLRVTAQLSDALTGNHVWADKFEGGTDAIFDLQDHITGAVVGIMDPTIRQAEIIRLRHERAINLSAYDHYLRALALNDLFTRESAVKMLFHCRQSIEIEPNFSHGYALAARVCIKQHVQGWMINPTEDRAIGLELAKGGLRADPEDSFVLATAGQAFAWLAHDLERGIAYIDQAIELNPHHSHTLMQSGVVRVRAGQTALAIEHLNRAIRLSPRDTRHYATFAALALCYVIDRNFEAAYDWAQRAVRQNENYLAAWREFAIASALLGRDLEAQRAIQRLLAIDPHYSVSAARSRFPCSVPEKFEHTFEALRKAGLRE